MKTKFYAFKNCFTAFAPTRKARLKIRFIYLIPFFLMLFFTNNVLANYTIGAGLSVDPNKTPALLNATGTISIYGTMAINADVKFTSTTPLTILIYGPSGQIYWYANKTLSFPEGTSVSFVKNPTTPPGLQPTSGNAAQLLQIGSVKYAAANDNSNNVICSFVEMDDMGGTAKVNPSTTTPDICFGASVALSANPIIPASSLTKVAWLVSPVSGSFSANNSSSASSTVLSNLAPGMYTVTCNLYIDGGNGNYFIAATNSLPVTVKALPAAIISGSTEVCQNSALPVISFTGLNGTGPFIFTYRTEAGIDQFVATNEGTTATVPVPVNIAGSFTYNLLSVQYAGAAACLQTQTGSAMVTINEATAIVKQPATANFCLGTDASIIAKASGTAIQYQWQRSTNGVAGNYSNLTNTTDYSGVNASSLNIVAPALAMSTDFFRVQVTGTCGVVTSNPLALKFGNVWMGSINADWNNPGNWSDGTLPSVACPDVYVPNRSNQPVLNSLPDAEVNNLLIDSGAVFTISNAAIKIAGNISNKGTLNISRGNLNFNGNSIQTIAGNIFVDHAIDNLTISNSIGLVIDSTPGNLLKITGALSFGNVNNSTLYTGDNLVLVSRSSSTARVADITNNNENHGNKFVGKVSVERYFPSRRSWRMVTSPISGGGSIFDTWQNGGVFEVGKGTYVTGQGATSPASANGLDWSTYNNSSLKTGVPLVPVLNTHTTKISKGLADTSDNLPYFIFVRGDRLPANTIYTVSNATTLSAKGKLQTGSQTFTASAIFNAATMIGNPYASSVEMNRIVRNNVMPRFVVWDSYINSDVGAYVYFEDFDGDGFYTATPAGTVLSSALQSGQAFSVQTATNAPASIQFLETAKSSATNLVTFRAISKETSLRANLYQLNGGDSTVLCDGLMAQFDKSFNPLVDGLDALKETNIKENLGLVRNTTYLSVERRPMPEVADTLFMQISGTIQRNYRLELVPAGLGNGLAISLLDAYTGKITAVNATSNTVYDFAITENAASAAIDRFKIVFKPATFKSLTATRQGNDIAIEWTVENEKNMQLYDVEKSTDGANFVKVNTTVATGTNQAMIVYKWLDKSPAVGNNYYRIRGVGNDGKFDYSNTVMLKMEDASASIRIFPNPVMDGAIGLEFNNMASGVYGVKLINALGQAILRKTIAHEFASPMEYIQSGYKLPTGIYRLEITSPQKQITLVKLMVQ